MATEKEKWQPAWIGWRQVIFVPSSKFAKTLLGASEQPREFGVLKKIAKEKEKVFHFGSLITRSGMWSVLLPY